MAKPSRGNLKLVYSADHDAFAADRPEIMNVAASKSWQDGKAHRLSSSSPAAGNRQ
jgi:hypothetical protein